MKTKAILGEIIIQAAGIRSLAEARMLIESGVTHLGLPLGPGVREEDVSPVQAARIIAELEGLAVFVLITYLTEPEEVVDFCRRIGVAAVQLHADLPPSNVARMKELMPELFAIKSLVVGVGVDVVAQARAHAENVDAFLTDTFDPATGARGATGCVHDWKIDRAVVQAVDKPVILAGGLTPDNVAQALRETTAAGVDAHTGLEDAHGDKSEAKVREFVAQGRESFGGLSHCQGVDETVQKTHSKEASVARRQGTVAWFNDRKGFGFITMEGGTDVFVHFQEIEREGFQTLNEGERVSFELVDEDKGPKAQHVTPLEGD